MTLLPDEVATSGRARRWTVLLFAMLFPAAGTWLYFIELTGSPYINTIYGLVKVVQFAFPAAWVLMESGGRWKQLLDRGRTAVIRLSWRAGLGPGLLSGGAMAVVILGGYALALRGNDAGGAVTVQLAARLAEIGAATPLRFMVLALFLSLVHSFLEEYYWRWFVFGRLKTLVGLTPAVALGSIAFAAHHVVVLWYYLGTGPASSLIWIFAAGVAAGGAVWAWHYHRSGSLLPGWISHVAADLAIMAAGWEMALG